MSKNCIPGMESGIKMHAIMDKTVDELNQNQNKILIAIHNDHTTLYYPSIHPSILNYY